MAWYLESTKAAGLQFKILKLDKVAKRATLQGPAGTPFERDISQEALDKYGYRVIQVADAPTQELTAG